MCVLTHVSEISGYLHVRPYNKHSRTCAQPTLMSDSSPSVGNKRKAKRQGGTKSKAAAKKLGATPKGDIEKRDEVLLISLPL